eukprot:734105-Pyramimonas_sp.AAC.1
MMPMADPRWEFRGLPDPRFLILNAYQPIGTEPTAPLESVEGCDPRRALGVRALSSLLGAGRSEMNQRMPASPPGLRLLRPSMVVARASLAALIIG